MPTQQLSPSEYQEQMFEIGLIMAFFMAKKHALIRECTFFHLYFILYYFIRIILNNRSRYEICLKLSVAPFLNIGKPSGADEVVTVCPVCHRKFYGYQQKNHYKIHYRSVHLQIREHQCSSCGKRFGRTDSARRHEKICPRRGLTFTGHF